jgi:hypothetical protein
MRPAWTDDHEQRHFQDEQMRSNSTAGMPLLVATKEGLKPGGRMPYLTPQSPTPVESQRGTADMHNSKVFRVLHAEFRVLSLVSDLFNLANEGGESDVHATLMWSHYADQFQGICLALDVSQFNNGICAGGFPVEYPAERQSLPPSYYDCWQSLSTNLSQSVYQPDAHSGLLLSPSDRAALERNRFLNLLKHKSPAWEYEHEVRMIYSLSELRASATYRKIESACEACKKKNIPAEECTNASYRDAIHLPPEAIRAIIFGTDCPIGNVKQVFEILSQLNHSHTQLYWSCLHSSRYAVQYVKADREYVDFIQKHRTEEIAYAKNHLRMDGDSMKLLASRKGVNYIPHPRTNPETK